MEKFLLWSLGGAAAALFAVQGVFWYLLRRRKLTIQAWQGWSRGWLAGSILLAALGGFLKLAGSPEQGPAALVAIFGGAGNGLVASLHRLTVRLLARPPR